MARVFDCFPFFNELDLLEIRLHELSDVVDRFVLAESTVTFSGKPKPLLFAKNRERYAKFLDRIEHIVVDDTPASVRSPWQRRTHQSNSLARGLEQIDGDDIVIFSDVDEIPRASAVRAAPEHLKTRFDVLCFELRMYNYFVNFESEERWLRSGPRAIRFSNLGRIEPLRKVKGPVAGSVRNTIRGLRAAFEMGRPVRRTLIRDAGWHFTYLGGMEAIINKVKSYAGHETVSQEILDPERLAARIRSGLSVDVNSNTRLGYRPLDDSFPRYLLENRERFGSFILRESDAAPLPRA